MDSDSLKIIVPLVTFIFGIVFTPLVESLKERFQREKDLGNFYLEIEDEIIQLQHRITTMAKAVENLVMLKDDAELRDGPLFYIPMETRLIFAEGVVERHYKHFSREKRNTIRAVVSQIDAISGYRHALKSRGSARENLDDNLKSKRNYIYTACCLRRNMKYLLHEKFNKFYGETSDKEMIEAEIEELGLNLTYDSLIYVKTFK